MVTVGNFSIHNLNLTIRNSSFLNVHGDASDKSQPTARHFNKAPREDFNYVV